MKRKSPDAPPSKCSSLKGLLVRGVPPTDEVISKILIIECDEKDIWKRSNHNRLKAQHPTVKLLRAA